MTTPTHVTSSPTTQIVRLPLRLRLQATLGEGALDGSWWPQSRDLSLELADLVDNFPVELGQVQRLVVSRPDWDAVPRRVRAARGLIKVGSYPHDDTHQVWLSMSTYTMIRLSVTTPADSSRPPTPTGVRAPGRPAVGDETVSDELDANSHWNDDGGSWWDPHPAAPSERV